MVETSSSEDKNISFGENNFKGINTSDMRYTTSAMLQPILTTDTDTVYEDARSKHTGI